MNTISPRRAIHRSPSPSSLRRRIEPLIAELVCSVLACSCAPLAAAPRPDLSLPLAYEAPMGSVADAAELDQWWRLFDDPQLEGLVASALKASTDARLALARLDEARAIRSSALSRYSLEGDVQGSATAERTELLSGEAGSSTALGDTTAALLSFNLSWEADLFGRVDASRQAADQDLAAARFIYEGSRAAVAADVGDALFSARGLAVQLADAQESVTLQQEFVRVLRARAVRGLASEADVDRVEADLRQTEAQVIRLGAELQAAKRALLVLTGSPQGAIADIKITPALSEGPAPPASLPGDLLRRRPDIREADARLRAATARGELQRLEFFPRLTLLPGIGLTTAGGEADYAVATWTIGASFVQPILDHPRLLAELGAQNARAEQAAIAYERAVQLAFSEVDQTFIRLEADARRVALLAEAEQRAARSYAAARERYARGLEDLTTTLDAERSWRAARLNLSNARIDVLRRTVAGFRALGGGWSPAEKSTDILQ